MIKRIEEDPNHLDELELTEMTERARVAQRAGEVLSHHEAKRRLGIIESPTAKWGATKRRAKS